MATSMTGTIAYDISTHITETYFPEEVVTSIWNTLPTIWKDYLDNAVGKPTAYTKEVSIYIKSKDQRVTAILDDWRYANFTGRFVSLPFCRPENLGTCCYLDLDMCPITDLRETLYVLGDLMIERNAFKTALNSELMKAPSVETFAKRFPRLKPALSDWLGEGITDLPVAVDLDMESLTNSAFAV